MYILLAAGHLAQEDDSDIRYIDSIFYLVLRIFYLLPVCSFVGVVAH